MLAQRIEAAIRDIPDFPKPGILFKDITPIFLDHQLCTDIVDDFAARYRGKVDAICGVESRGFIFGMMLANRLQVPFIPARKKGKLPAETDSYTYDLEYGTATLELHKDVLQAGQRVLIHDDLLATGGTAAATAELIKMQGAQIAGFAFMVELSFLQGRAALEQYKGSCYAQISYT